MKRLLVILILLALGLWSLFIGVKDISLAQLLSGDPMAVDVLLISRLPRLTAVVISGVGMAVVGLLMQQLSRNKFVSPQTGTTINAAQLGVVLATIFTKTLTLQVKMIWAFIFSLVFTVLFMAIVQRIKFKNVIFVPLVGMMFSGVIGSVTEFVAYRYNIVQNANDWLQGDFSLILKGNYEALYVCLPCIILAFLYANYFNIVGMGDDFAKNLGVHYNLVLYGGLTIVSIVTAGVVVTVGTIPFVGLIVPNIVSIYKGDRLKGTLLDTAIFGAVFVLICDIFGRLIIAPYEIPIGLTVGVVGSGLFVVLMLRRGRYATG